MSWMLLGVAVTAGLGYLVAALVFFPSPMLPSEREVISVMGLMEPEAKRDLLKRGLTDSVEAREPHPTAAPGSVIWQDPPSGVAVPRGSTVSLVLSAGPPTVTVPDVKGYDVDIAQKVLAAVGLHLDGIDSVEAKGVPVGMAGGTNPAAGERLQAGHSITLHLAQ